MTKTLPSERLASLVCESIKEDFDKAFIRFEEILKEKKTDIARDAAIQRKDYNEKHKEEIFFAL